MKITRITFPIDNVRYGGALTIERVLMRTPGVVHIYVNPVIEMAYIGYDSSLTTSDRLITAIEHAGFHAGMPTIR